MILPSLLFRRAVTGPTSRGDGRFTIATLFPLRVNPKLSAYPQKQIVDGEGDLAAGEIAAIGGEAERRCAVIGDRRAGDAVDGAVEHRADGIAIAATIRRNAQIP